MKKIYLHAIDFKINFDDDYTKLKKIFESGYLLSRRLSHYSSPIGFNGLDYISLCDYDKRNLKALDGRSEYNAYHTYIENGLSLVLDDKIKVIKPKIIYPHDGTIYDTCDISKIGLIKRASDMPDEVQVKDKISLEHLIAITLSKEKFLMNYSKEDYLNYLKMIKELLDLYHYNVPIVDLQLIKTIL